KRLGGFGGFSWSNPNFTSRLDVPRLLVALSYPPLLYVAHRAHDLGTALLKAPTALDLSVAGTWFALFATSLRLYRPLRRKKPAVPGWLASDAGRFGVAVAWISAISWGYLGRFVVPFDLLTLGVAAAVVATILVAAPRFSARHREIIELGVYAVIALLAEQPWSWFLLAPFQALLYADHRLLGTPEAPSSEKEPSRPAQAWSTLAILILGVTVMLAKEIFFEPGLRPGAL
ncbi:MAG: hypothetical protein KC466_01010, partial [Myxococcales bacterium]|nr:hypothetical protein [Myxococcales bacterium]